MEKVKEFLSNDHIQAASVSGICIIALALFFKRLLHMEVPQLEAAIPGFVFTIWEAVHGRIKSGYWSDVTPWLLMMLLSVALIMLKYLV